MKLLCRMFGHKVPRHGYYLNTPYFKRGRNRKVDGIGRIHQSLTTDCERCDSTFMFGMIHDYPAHGHLVTKVDGYYEEGTK